MPLENKERMAFRPRKMLGRIVARRVQAPRVSSDPKGSGSQDWLGALRATHPAPRAPFPEGREVMAEEIAKNREFAWESFLGSPNVRAETTARRLARAPVAERSLRRSRAGIEPALARWPRRWPSHARAREDAHAHARGLSATACGESFTDPPSGHQLWAPGAVVQE